MKANYNSPAPRFLEILAGLGIVIFALLFTFIIAVAIHGIHVGDRSSQDFWWFAIFAFGGIGCWVLAWRLLSGRSRRDGGLFSPTLLRVASLIFLVAGPVTIKSHPLGIVEAVALVGAAGSEKLAGAQEAASAERLIGTWKIVQTVTSDPSGERIDNDPPPGMYIFTGRYMSNLIVPYWEPRPMISRKSSDEERLGAYDNFIADGGEYWVVGDVIQTHNFIAKVPNAMRPERKRGEGIRYKFHFEEDELVITMTQQGWAPSGSITYRLLRME